jgi:uncharacterized membrane protein YgcG
VKPLRRFTLSLALLAVALSANAELPARPEFGVLDQAGLLPLSILKATERMLIQHEKLTEEQVSVLTVTDVKKGELHSYGDSVLEKWRERAPQPPNSVLIVVNGETGELEIRTGLGLDPVLTSDKISVIRNRFFKPEWKTGKKSRAIILSLVESFRVLDSPLITSGELIDTYDRAGYSGGWTPVVRSPRPWIAWLLVLFGIGFVAFALVRILIGEVHYTATGWFRVSALKNLKRLVPRRKKTPTLVTGGGVSGRY